ncbi:MAG: WD40 repeat domain-containing protein [Microcystis aeruginosa]
MIKFWSLTSKEELATLDQPTDKLLSLVISADGKYLIIGSADKTVKIWQNKAFLP